MRPIIYLLTLFLGWFPTTVLSGDPDFLWIPADIKFPQINQCDEGFVLRREREGSAWNLLPEINRYLGDYCGETDDGRLVNFSVVESKKESGKSAILKYYLLIDGKIRSNPGYAFMFKAKQPDAWVAGMGPTWLGYLANRDEMRLFFRNKDKTTELTATLHRVAPLVQSNPASSQSGTNGEDR